MRSLFGDRVNVTVPVPMKVPPSLGQNFGIGNVVRSISSPRRTISLTGASPFGTWTGATRRFRRSRVAVIISAVDSFGSRPTASA
jgi:hypothetical protein